MVANLTTANTVDRRKSSIARLARYFAARAIPGRPVFLARSDSGLGFYSHREDVVGRHVAKYGAHEPTLTDWLLRQMAAGGPGIFVDVGAHIGWHSIHAARLASVTSVVAFEPDTFNGAMLRRNIVLNHADKVLLCPCAVGARPGLAHLHRYRSTNFGAHSLAVDHGFDSIIVPVMTLDQALEDLGLADQPILAIKIDVEGYEPAVLQGARRALAHAARVAFELTPAASAAANLSVEGMFSQLAEAGFAPSILPHEGVLTPTSYEALGQFQGQCDVIAERPGEH